MSLDLSEIIDSIIEFGIVNGQECLVHQVGYKEPVVFCVDFSHAASITIQETVDGISLLARFEAFLLLESLHFVLHDLKERNCLDFAADFEAECAQSVDDDHRVGASFVQPAQNSVCISEVLRPVVYPEYFQANHDVFRLVVGLLWEDAEELILLAADVSDSFVVVQRLNLRRLPRELLVLSLKTVQLYQSTLLVLAVGLGVERQ